MRVKSSTRACPDASLPRNSGTSALVVAEPRVQPRRDPDVFRRDTGDFQKAKTDLAVIKKILSVDSGLKNLPETQNILQRVKLLAATLSN